jgi:hypothetical protein
MPDQFYDLNPISVIDQDQWDLNMPEVALQFREGPTVYTPLMDWSAEAAGTGARTAKTHELLQGDVNSNSIPFTANYIAALGLDSRQRTMNYARYGDKVQLHKSQNIFTQWQKSGGKDWRPLLRGILGQSVQRKLEMISRNAFASLTPSGFATYAGSASDVSGLGSADTFDLDIINAWRLRLGQTGSPVIPGDTAAASVAIVPPGVEYDFFEQLKAASGNMAEMFVQATEYRDSALKGEMGTILGVRFVVHPNDSYGRNNAVLYNTGAITTQYGVTEPIKIGDGSPDPETTTVDGVWNVGQKNVTHYVQLEAFGASDYAVNDFVTVHFSRTATFGVTNGVDPLDGRSIIRRVVSVDAGNDRLAFDLPILFDYNAPISAASESGGSMGTFYAFVTKARHVAMIVVMGSRGAFQADVAQPVSFYEPKPIDDFDSVWRFTWDLHAGWNLKNPHVYEVHFCSVSLAKPGGIIVP